MRNHTKKKLVYGVGVNDADYEVQSAGFDGKAAWKCPFYRKWSAMLERCYSEKSLVKNKSYADCYVCPEWLVFSNFKSWMECQDWVGKCLDKDLITTGNKIYSPSKCCFLDQKLNSFLTDGKARRGSLMLGVSLDRETGKFKAECSNLIFGNSLKGKNLGRFNSEIEAHFAWKKRKHEISCQLADLQTDERVANALRTRYL